MTGLLAALQLAATVLGAWTLAAVVAAVPLIGWLRLQAVANEALTREARRRDWLEAARRPLR